ncbi:hypothetical protein [Actinomadura harenae]|uniref:Uncharacterized protein n=1 Tax=Actinomadura harenae TaxID=2483351 RepID=A0A3M2LQD5_9ACTN|nr:hypothetical protein [Actinomadura harenae]RMI39617.1 hypothetical protein EBO15_29055 [Actinomadura harenae]
MAGLVILGVLLVAAVTLVAVGASREKRVDEDERVRGLRTWAAEHRWSFAEGDLGVPWRARVGRDGLRVRELLTGQVGSLPASLGHGTYPTRRVITDAEGRKRTETVTNHLTVLVVHLDERPGAPLQAESDLPDATRDRLSSDLIRAHLDDEPPLWSLRRGELMVVRYSPLHPSDLDEHLGTIRRLAGLLGDPP